LALAALAALRVATTVLMAERHLSGCTALQRVEVLGQTAAGLAVRGLVAT
jgi:hypothetical protein